LADHKPPPSPAPRALFLVNRHARRGGEAIGAAVTRLEAGGITLLRRDLPKKHGIPALIREHVGQVDFVILGGGDGTLNGAAEALIETGLPLGVLPMGTANDFARTLGIPADLAAAAEVIAAGRSRRIDVGEVNGHPFLNVASIGFSAELARALSAEAKKRWGRLGYARAALTILRRSQRFRLDLAYDGTHERVWSTQLAVGNGKFYGGGLQVEESAAPDDGRLDVYSLEVDHWWELVALAPALRRGTQGRWRKVRSFSTTELQVTTRHHHDVNCDGELVTATPATFRLRPAALSVFAPAGEGTA